MALTCNDAAKRIPTLQIIKIVSAAFLIFIEVKGVPGFKNIPKRSRHFSWQQLLLNSML
jgi:hypothetical protein